MKSSTDIVQTAPSSLLLLGAPGSGKSFLATFFPAPYFVNADNNLRGPIVKRKSLGYDSEVFFDDILFATKEELEAISVPSGDIAVLPEHLADDGSKVLPVPREWRGRRMWACIDAALHDDRVQTIVLDSLTTIVDIILDEVLRQQSIILPKKGSAFISTLINTRGGRTIDDPLEFAHWGAFGKLMKNFITTIKASGKRLVAIGHVSSSNDQFGVPMDFIAVPGQFKDTIAGYFEECWLLRTQIKGREIERRVYTTTPRETQTGLGLKSAAGLPPEFLLDIDDLMKKIKITPANEKDAN